MSRPGDPRALHAWLALALLAGSAIPARAARPERRPAVPVASASVRLDDRGPGLLTLWLPHAPADSATTLREAEQALGARFESVHGWRDAFGWSCVATWPAAAGDDPGLRVLDLDPAPLVVIARRSGARSLSLRVAAPAGLPLRPVRGLDPEWARIARRSGSIWLAADGPLPRPSRWVAGFSAADRAAAATHALALLALPLGAVAFVRRRARRALAAGADPARVYFASAQWLAALPLLVLVGLFASLGSPLAHWLWHALEGVTGRLAPLAMFPLVMLPVSATAAASAWASHLVTRETRGTDRTPREVAVQTAWALAATAGPVLAVSLWKLALGFGQVALGAALGALSLALAAVARVRAARQLGLEPHAVTHGPLRDRLAGLAARAGVQVQQLYVVPMRRVRMANAFAVRGGIVILTDWLLEHLERRELDAVLAHELAHLKLGHPLRLALAAVAATLLGGTVAAFTGWLGAGAIGLVAALLVTRLVSRRFEHQADALAIEICGDPEALVTGLARITRLNHIPLDWSRASERALTHPSTLRRARAIARAAGIPEARLRELLERDEPVRDAEPVPAQARPGGKAFSSAFKRAMSARLSWMMLLSAATLAAAGVALARALALPRPLACVAGGVLAFAALCVVQDLVAARGLSRLREAVARGVGAASGAHFVGLAPGATPRVYEGSFDWDLGYLALEPDALAYRGEETSFRLPRAAIVDVRSVPGPPGWVPAPRVAIQWRDPAGGAGGVVQLRPAAVTRLAALPRAVAALAGELRSWREARPAALAGTPVPPPLESGVTGVPLARFASPRQLVPVVVLLAILCALLATLVRMPLSPVAGPGAADAWLGASLAVALHRVPWWRAAARREDGAPAERRAA